MKLGRTQRLVLEYLKEHPEQWPTTTLTKALQLTDDQCLNALKRLHLRGYVMRVQNGAEFRWTITPSQLLN